MKDSSFFQEILRSRWPELTELQIERLSAFRDRVVSENEKQNLTRLLSPLDFYEGHILDVKKLLELRWTGSPALDLGSGAGVPGLVAALIGGDSWILAESEKRKAAFLEETVRELGLAHVRVVSDRAENFLRKQAASVVVARAVGPITRIFSWLRDCSTWNTLILFKGPGWDEEWKTFSEGPDRGKLEIQDEVTYTVGAESKRRRLLRLARVLRRTKIER